MKTIKIAITALLLLVAITNNYAQKMWLSGNYSNGKITYYENGKPLSLPAFYNGEYYNASGGIVVYGEFKKDGNNSWYFDIEKSGGNSVVSKSGTFTKQSYNCPISGTVEGYITSADGQRTEVASFENLQNGQQVTVTSAAWGTKECNNKTFSVYYVTMIKEANPNMEQRRVTPNGGYETNAPDLDIVTLTGKIVSRNKNEGMGSLDVPNWATFKADGRTYNVEISSEKPINSNAKITLEGYFKEVYYQGVRKTESVFFVTKVR